jgi:hypothetical protein
MRVLVDFDCSGRNLGAGSEGYVDCIGGTNPCTGSLELSARKLWMRILPRRRLRFSTINHPIIVHELCQPIPWNHTAWQ